MSGSILIPGQVVGWSRARLNHKTGQVFTDKRMRTAQGTLRDAWQAAGSPGPYAGPMGVSVTVVICRPKSHYRVDGITLAAAGERAPIPVCTPDLDNLQKQIGDSWNGCLWRDDRQIAHWDVTRRYAIHGEAEHVRVDYWQATLDDEEFAA